MEYQSAEPAPSAAELERIPAEVEAEREAARRREMAEQVEREAALPPLAHGCHATLSTTPVSPPLPELSCPGCTGADASYLARLVFDHCANALA